MSSTSAPEKRFRLIRGKVQQQVDSFARDVRIGLTATPKFLPPKYFYDEKGSELFDRICELPEYYPTCTEAAILEQNAEHIIGTFGKIPPELVELGSGSSTKIRYLIEACLRKKTCLEYITIDISETALTNGANQLLADYPQLYITALVGEYQVALENLQQLDVQKRLFLWLGSTIGNFEPREAIQFLKLFRQYMRPGDYFLIGADLQKDVKILEKAYNDSQGVTAAFNLNLLKRINQEFAANFDLSAFQHRALYNQKLNRIEMHLVSLKDQTVKIRALDLEIRFEKNESIHTENSYKFSIAQLHEITRQAGFAIESQWFDDARWFSEILLKPL